MQKDFSKTRKGELTNSLTHGLGVGFSIFGLVMLILRASSWVNAWMRVSFILYATSLIILFFASALYHGFQTPKIKDFLKTIDHSAIYILIAGTYTPITLVSLRGGWGWALFGTVWGLAFIGIVLRGVYKDKYPRIATATYVLMGWLCVIALPVLYTALGKTGFSLLALGGVIYTAGLIFYNWEELSYSHAIWHLFVLGGAICHFFVVYFYVVPQ